MTLKINVIIHTIIKASEANWDMIIMRLKLGHQPQINKKKGLSDLFLGFENFEVRN